MTDTALPPGITLDLTETPRDEDIATVHARLESFNMRAAPPYDRRDVCVFLRDAEGTIVGGLTGYTQWQWLYVDYLWLSEEMRGRKLGERLLRTAEDEAMRRGCAWSRLYTYDFQAPSFYEGQGYTRWGVLEDYPPGHRQIWFRKALTEPSSAG